MAYHSWCGGRQLGGSDAPTPPFKFSVPVYWTQFDKILLTILNISNTMNIEQLFGIVVMKGDIRCCVKMKRNC